jgi:DNA-binding beta-propeller fold protein YncE
MPRKELLLKKLFLFFAIFAALLAAPPAYKTIKQIKVGGANRWDYPLVDAANHRLYIAHMGQVDVVDTAAQKVVGSVMGTTGVHGVTIAPDLGRGFASDGGDNDVTIFDLKTLATLSKVKTGQNPDAIIYEPVSKRVFTLNGRSKDATAIDAKTGNVITASLALGGKPEFAQVDGKGHIFVNIEDTAEIAQIDAKDALVSKRYSIAPCEDPSGLAIDPKGRLYSVCANKLMIVSDPAKGTVIATAPIGLGCDGVAFDDGYAFSANGADGTITMVGETSPGKFEVVATIPSQRSARTIASDPKAHKLYLPTAEIGTAPAESKDGKKGRPQMVPDSFAVLVVGR